MKIRMIGLGRMGRNMARRILAKGYSAAAYNRSPDKTEELAQYGGQPC